MAVFTAIAIGALAVAAAGTVYSARQQKKAAAQSRRAQAAEQRRADIAAARERRGAIRNSRVMRASIEAQAAGTGLLGSSSFSAATSNVQGRTNENLSFLDQTGALSAQASEANIAASRYASRANTGQAVANLGGQAFNWAVGNMAPTPQGTG